MPKGIHTRGTPKGVHTVDFLIWHFVRALDFDLKLPYLFPNLHQSAPTVLEYVLIRV